MTTAAFSSLAVSSSPKFLQPTRRCSSMAAIISSPASLSLQLIRPRQQHLRQRPSFSGLHRGCDTPKGLGCGFGLPISRRMKSRVAPFAASHEESKFSEADIENEKDRIEQQTNESQEAWGQTLASFKEQALKLQSVSQEAYETYTRKATVVLKDTAEQLQIQAEKAKDDLSVIAKELSEEGKQYLTTAAEHSPEPVKDVVETFASSSENLHHISKVQEFYVGVPYGAILSLGGFLNFMLTGSISAIRFGVILGGILLTLSVFSLRLWRKGEHSSLALNAQAVISGILSLREIRLLFQGPTLTGVVNTIISCAIVAFYAYRIKYQQQPGKPNLEEGV